MRITRRLFIKSLTAAAISVGIQVPAFSSAREPYVFEGEVASYIGRSPGGFVGGQVIKKVGRWDGVGFPVTTFTNSFPSRLETYYDIDLACTEREVPKDFWKKPENEKYPNFHTWLRTHRYGETTKEAILKMNLASSKKWLAAL